MYDMSNEYAQWTKIRNKLQFREAAIFAVFGNFFDQNPAGRSNFFFL